MNQSPMEPKQQKHRFKANKKGLLKRFLTALLITLFVFLSIFSWTYFSDSGTQFAFERAKLFFPDELEVEGVKGNLFQGIKVNKVAWNDSSVQVTAQSVLIECPFQEWLTGWLRCDSIEADSVSVTLIETPNTSSLSSADFLTNHEMKKTPIVLPPLPEFELGINALVDKLVIRQFLLLQKSSSNHAQEGRDKLTTLVDITDIKAIQVGWKQEQASVKELTFNYLEHDIVFSGMAAPINHWKHQFQLRMKGAHIDAKANSKGTIKNAKLNIESNKTIKGFVKADWSWIDNLNINNGFIQFHKQTIDIDQEVIEVAESKAAFSLLWPTLQLDYQGNIQYQDIDKLTTEVSLYSANVIAWQSDTKARIKSNGVIDRAGFDQWLLQLLDVLESKALDSDLKKDKSSDIYLVDIDAELSIKDGELNLKTDKFIFDSINGNITAKANYSGTEITSFNAQYQVEVSDYNLYSIFQVLALHASGEVHFAKSLSMSHSIKAAKLGYKDIVIEQLDAFIEKEKNYKLSLALEQFSLPDLIISKIQLNGTGDEQRHMLSLTALVNEGFPVSINAKGGLELDNWLWRGFDSKAELLINAQNVLLDFKQAEVSREAFSVESLCLTINGRVCTSGKIKDWEDWQVAAIFDSFDLTSLNPIFAQFLPSSSLAFGGRINGELASEGNGIVIESLNTSIIIDEFNYKEPLFALQSKKINLYSDDNFALQLESKEHIFSSLTIGNEFDLVWPKTTAHLSKLSELWQGKLELDSVMLMTNALNSNSSIPNIDTMIIDFQLSPTLLNSAASIDFSNQDFVRTAANFNWPISNASEFDATIDLHLKDFSWVKQWQTRIDALKATWQQSVIIKGNFSAPKITSEGTLLVDRFVIEEIGLDIEDSRLDITNADEKIKVVGSVKNKKSELKVNSEISVLPELEANVNVLGERVVILDNSSTKVVVSPNINAYLSNDNMKLTGSVQFNEVNVKIKSLPKQPNRLSADQIIIGQQDETASTKQKYSIDLDLIVDDKVSLEAFGLTSQLKGRLRSILTSEQPVNLTGQLNLVNGKFVAYKQELVIEQGQLIFLGNPENPGLQLRAVRKLDDYTVGVLANGTVQNPQLSLFSEPATSDENVLSLLITGRPIDSLSQSEGNALVNAAISLGLDEANKLAQKIGTVLGIDNVEIKSKSVAEGNRVDIATKINDKLSIGYGTVINSSNELQPSWIIELRLTPELTIETISGEEVSTTLNYKKKMNSIGNKSSKDNN